MSSLPLRWQDPLPPPTALALLVCSSASFQSGICDANRSSGGEISVANIARGPTTAGRDKSSSRCVAGVPRGLPIPQRYSQDCSAAPLPSPLSAPSKPKGGAREPVGDNSIGTACATSAGTPPS